MLTFVCVDIHTHIYTYVVMEIGFNSESLVVPHYPEGEAEQRRQPRQAPSPGTSAVRGGLAWGGDCVWCLEELSLAPELVSAPAHLFSFAGFKGRLVH